MNRRSFIRQALAGAGMLALSRTGLLTAAGEPAAGTLSAADRVELGRTGIVTSRMAVGSGTSGVRKASNQTRLGLEKFLEIVNHAYERGIDFWDTADQYGSHEFFRPALDSIPREKVVILTKSTSRDAGGMESDIERFRSELGTDYMDILLLHCLMEDDWTEKMQAVMDVVSEAREKGVIRTFGVSCHTLGALKAAVESPWVEVILARFNHLGVAMDDTPQVVAPLLQKARDSGKGVIAMKIAGAGRMREQIQESLQFVLSRPFVDSFSMGFESVAEMDDLFDKVSAVKA